MSDQFDPEVINRENRTVFQSFYDYLLDQELSDQTVRKHMTNIDFYMNQFLQILKPEPAWKALLPETVASFFVPFYTEQVEWASAGDLKGMLSSIRKLGDFFVSNGMISRDDLKSLKIFLKDHQKEWLSALGGVGEIPGESAPSEENLPLRRFTEEAAALWDKLSSDERFRISSSVWCPECGREVTAFFQAGALVDGVLYLQGTCSNCTNEVGIRVKL